MFGHGSGQIWFESLQCNGDEDHILQCSYNLFGSNCGHDEDVGLICGTSTTTLDFESTSSLVETGMYSN